MGGMQAMRRTNRPYFFITRRFIRFPVQEHLDWALHIVAVFPAPVLGISLHTRSFGKDLQKVFGSDLCDREARDHRVAFGKRGSQSRAGQRIAGLVYASMPAEAIKPIFEFSCPMASAGK
jgi:hypothetical protein